MKISNEAKTGMFVVVCIAAFIGMAMKVGNFSFTKKGYELKTTFHFTGGVKVHAPVCLSGVEVGEVKAINLVYGDDTLVEVVLYLNEGVKVRKDSKALSTTLGLMGEKYIEIKSGKSPEFAQNGDSIQGQDPFQMEELIDIGKKVAGDISTTTQKFGTVADNVNGLLTANRPKIDSMMDDFGETAENFREFSDDVKYHPWKVLLKGREVPKPERDKARALRLIERAKALGVEPPAAALAVLDKNTEPAAPVAGKQNFGPAN